MEDTSVQFNLGTIDSLVSLLNSTYPRTSTILSAVSVTRSPRSRRTQRIWDTISSVAADCYRERTTAAQSIKRQPVGVSLGSCDLIQSSLKVPRLMNANGGELFLYPAFVLYFVSQQAFALVDIRDLRLDYNPVSFIEEEGVPTDAELIRHTWKKANKDGSPDRRFANNHQIPILKYGDIRLTSKSGLNEAYMISHAAFSGEIRRCFPQFSMRSTTGHRITN